jgi:hypothetical protein
MVLAPRQFYNPQRMKEIKSLRDENIIYADFGGRDIYDRKPGKPISVRLKKKCKLLFIVAPKKSAEAV